MHDYLLFTIIGGVVLASGLLTSIILFYGTKFRTVKNGIAFGFRRYSSTDLDECRFTVDKYKFTSHDLPITVRQTPKTRKGVWTIRIKVCKNGEYLRTHSLEVRNEQKADELMAEINRSVRIC